MRVLALFVLLLLLSVNSLARTQVVMLGTGTQHYNLSTCEGIYREEKQ